MTIVDNEKKLKELEARIAELESWHDTNGFPALMYHEKGIGKFQKFINPEFEEEDRIANLSKEERAKELKLNA